MSEDDRTCGVCGEIGRNNWLTYGDAKNPGKVTAVACEWCMEVRQLKEYGETGEIRTRLFTDALLSGRDEEGTEKYIAGKRLHGGYADWAWQLCTMRNSPAPHVPEARWSEYKRHMNRALDLAPPRYAHESEYPLLRGHPSPRWPGSGLEDPYGRNEAQEGVCRVIRHHLDEAWKLGVYTEEGQPVAQPRQYRAIRESYNRIYDQVKGFESVIWFGGLQEFVRKDTARGHSAKYGDLHVMCYVMCGRARLQVEIGDGSFVCIQTDETSSERCMGLHGISATEAQSVSMLTGAIEAWKLGKLKFKRDSKIGVV
jgi:hypothetical protein